MNHLENQQRHYFQQLGRAVAGEREEQLDKVYLCCPRGRLTGFEPKLQLAHARLIQTCLCGHEHAQMFSSVCKLTCMFARVSAKKKKKRERGQRSPLLINTAHHHEVGPAALSKLGTTSCFTAPTPPAPMSPSAALQRGKTSKVKV